MRELSVSEQRYQAVLAVIKDGETVVSVAARFGVSRKTVHQWLSRYEADGLEGLSDRSHRPRSSPLQMPAVVEVALVDLRRRHPSWGPRRLVYELRRTGVEPVPSESAAYRALRRFGLIDPAARRPRDRKWKRWERGRAMELWQMDVVGGFVLADGRRAKALSVFALTAQAQVRAWPDRLAPSPRSMAPAPARCSPPVRRSGTIRRLRRTFPRPRRCASRPAGGCPRVRRREPPCRPGSAALPLLSAARTPWPCSSAYVRRRGAGHCFRRGLAVPAAPVWRRRPAKPRGVVAAAARPAGAFAEC